MHLSGSFRVNLELGAPVANFEHWASVENPGSVETCLAELVIPCICRWTIKLYTYVNVAGFCWPCCESTVKQGQEINAKKLSGLCCMVGDCLHCLDRRPVSFPRTMLHHIHKTFCPVTVSAPGPDHLKPHFGSLTAEGICFLAWNIWHRSRRIPQRGIILGAFRLPNGSAQLGCFHQSMWKIVQNEKETLMPWRTCLVSVFQEWQITSRA